LIQIGHSDVRKQELMLVTVLKETLLAESGQSGSNKIMKREFRISVAL